MVLQGLISTLSANRNKVCVSATFCVLELRVGFSALAEVRSVSDFILSYVRPLLSVRPS